MTIKLNRFLLSASLAMIGSTITPAVADEWNKETTFQFSAPVEVPGKVLEAGKYVFRLVDSDSDRKIVQIFSEDSTGKQSLVTTILAVSNYRMTTPDKTIIQFDERPAGRPEAIKNWFYPGDNTGWQFVYPKSERLTETVASASPAPTPAPAEPIAEPPAEVPAAPVLQPPPAETDLTVVEQETVIAQLEPPPAPSDVIQTTTDELPKTAGYSGILLLTAAAMLGLGILAVSFSLRRAQS